MDLAELLKLLGNEVLPAAPLRPSRRKREEALRGAAFRLNEALRDHHD